MSSRRVAVVDYGSGNVASVVNALRNAGAEPEILQTAEAVARADRVVLPGVGAAGAALDRLWRGGFDGALTALHRAGHPILAICVGMQVLAEELEEFGLKRGLGWISGRVVKLADNAESGIRVPHVGWSEVVPANDDSTWFGTDPAKRYFYFCHSYRLVGKQAVAATATHGTVFTAAIQFDSVLAVQFHPEKSSTNGRNLLERFLDWTP
jgi:imidazole glycerol-phosphate synthase subunit HisH